MTFRGHRAQCARRENRWPRTMRLTLPATPEELFTATKQHAVAKLAHASVGPPRATKWPPPALLPAPRPRPLTGSPTRMRSAVEMQRRPSQIGGKFRLRTPSLSPPKEAPTFHIGARTGSACSLSPPSSPTSQLCALKRCQAPHNRSHPSKQFSPTVGQAGVPLQQAELGPQRPRLPTPAPSRGPSPAPAPPLNLAFDLPTGLPSAPDSAPSWKLPLRGVHRPL